jgi:hypothetical protein
MGIYQRLMAVQFCQDDSKKLLGCMVYMVFELSNKTYPNIITSAYPGIHLANSI